ncbi:MAG: Gfo/Idh/MocA family oxidoreductase [Cyanobacteria bacterium HKST-UBA02]|nr:Gfo/Idh/MocA family oxidoreductase [Cyanobacteria bacterium HKST-UBA02]
MATNRIRVALVGYGLAGRVFHAPLIARTAGMEITTIVTANPERRAEASRDFPDARLAATFDEVILAAADLDFVVIASPNKYHAPQAAVALDAGLHVVVDKPFATSSRDCRMLIELSKEKKRLLTVFQNRRFDNDFLTVKKLIEDGSLSPVLRLESRFERYRPTVDPNKWRESGSIEDGAGLLFDLQSHLVDQACNLFGRPESVYAEVRNTRPGATASDDTFVALTFPGGVSTHLWANVISAKRAPRFRVLALNGTFEKYGLDPQEEALRAGGHPGDQGWGIEPDELSGTLTSGEDGAEKTIKSETGCYEKFYSLTAEAIRTGGRPPVDPEEALLVMEIIEAAMKSAASRSAVSIASVS